MCLFFARFLIPPPPFSFSNPTGGLPIDSTSTSGWRSSLVANSRTISPHPWTGPAPRGQLGGKPALAAAGDEWRGKRGTGIEVRLSWTATAHQHLRLHSIYFSGDIDWGRRMLLWLACSLAGKQKKKKEKKGKPPFACRRRRGSRRAMEPRRLAGRQWKDAKVQCRSCGDVRGKRFASTAFRGWGGACEEKRINLSTYARYGTVLCAARTGAPTTSGTTFAKTRNPKSIDP